MTPAIAAGTVDITVVTKSGTSATSSSDKFTFQVPAPIVTALSSPSGFSNGGDTVVISGINLSGATGVSFVVPASAGSAAQSIAAASFTINPDGTVTAVTPSVAAPPAGGSVTVDVEVTTPNGTSVTSPVDQFVFTPAGAAPTVTGILGNPSADSLAAPPAGGGSAAIPTGSTAGGDLLTITGTNFTDVTGVTFGGVAAQSFTVVSPTRIDVVTPALVVAPSGGSTTLDVQVTTTAGTSAKSSSDLVTFAPPPPKISSLSAASGFAAGGDTLTIYGSNLSDATAVLFVVPASAGSAGQTLSVAAATSSTPGFTVNADGSLTVTVPALAGTLPTGGLTADIRVETPAGTTGVTSADQFVFTPTGAAPTVAGLSAQSGLTTGGQLVTITGNNFTDVTGVSFGSQAAALFYVASPTTIVALSPVSAAASTVNVTVTSTAGTSTTSAATAFTTSAPSSGGSGSSSAPPSQSYVVNSTPFGPPGSQIGVGSGPAPMTSFSPPSAPNVPTVNPVYTSSGTSWSKSDGGTVVYSQPMSGTDPQSGATVVGLWSDTVIFTFSGSGNSSAYSNTHIVREDKIVYYMKVTETDGTGYTLASQSDTTVTYDHTISGGTSSTNTYTVDTVASGSSVETQLGVTSPGAPGLANDTDSATYSSKSHLDASLLGGATTVNYNDSTDGSDQYQHSLASAASTQTENDLLVGGDAWHQDDKGNYQQNADGTWTATETANQNGSGTDLYADAGTQIVASLTPDPTGSTALIDLVTSADVGADLYTTSGTGTTSIGLDGSSTMTESDQADDAGVEDLQTGDAGIVASNEVDPTGMLVVGTDVFGDTSDDQSDYTDGDTQSGGSAGGGDQSKSHDDDKDTFGSHDNSTVVGTQTGPLGAITTVTITDKSSDNGVQTAQDENDDNETQASPSNGQTETDKFTFDTGGNEQDKSTDIGKIVIFTQGPLSGNDLYQSTETITLKGQGTNGETMDDPGTETDISGTGGIDDSESDKLTDDSQSTGNINIEDVFDSQETLIGADGSVTNTGAHDDTNDTLSVGSQDDSTDQEGEAASAGNDATTDDSNDHASSTAEDETTDTSTVITNVIQPVPNGVLVSSSTVGDDFEDFSTDTAGSDATVETAGAQTLAAGSTASRDDSSDDFTDDTTDATNSQSFTLLAAIDPATGVQTIATGGDVGIASGTANESDDVSDNTTGGAAGNSEVFKEVADLVGADSSSDKGPSDISVVGSPQTGTSVNFSEKLNYDDEAEDSTTGQDNSTQPTADTGHLTFQVGGEADVSGTVFSTTTNSVNASGIDATDTVTDSATLGGMAGSEDNGEEDFANANGQQVSDTEADTESDADGSQVAANEAQNSQATISAVDPTTGLNLSISAVDSSSDTQDAQDFLNGTDQGSSATPDVASGDDEVTDHQVSSDHGRITMATTGTDPTGTVLNVQETVTIDGSGTEDDSEEENLSANGENVDTLKDSSGGNATVTDLVRGTLTSVDPSTGVTTTGNINELFVDQGSDSEQETDTNSAGPTANGDVVTQSDNNSDTLSWNTSDTTTQTNLNGTQAAPPVNDNWNGSDVQVAVNGVVTDQGSAPAVPASTSGGSAPTITGLVAAGAVAAQGNTDGSTVVVLTGTGFTSDTQVTFDGVAASNATVLSSTQIVAVAPAHGAGTVHVLATNTAGSSVSTPANQFAYQAAGASTPPSGSNSQPDANLTLAQKQQIWALQAEMLRLVGRIQDVKQQLANGNLAPPSQKTHQKLLYDLQNRLQTIENQLNITHQPADPVASMKFGEKFVAALEIVLKDGKLEAGIKAKLEQLLEPENLAKLVGTMTAMAAAYATLHGTPLAPLLAIADVGMAASVGTETALALFQIYLDLDGATTQGELQVAAGGMANQLSGKLVDVIVSVVAKQAARGAAAGIGKKSGKNLNSNNARSNFGVYEIRVKGTVLKGKVGKVDLNRVTQSSGLPTRLHQQLRKLREKFGKKNVTGEVVEELPNSTTRAAKQAETARIQRILEQTGVVPIGNRKSFRPPN